MEGSISENNESPADSGQTKPGQYTGLISGSEIAGTTAQGYKFKASVGDMVSEIKQKTGSGWVVYSSVQGSVVSQ